MFDDGGRGSHQCQRGAVLLSVASHALAGCDLSGERARSALPFLFSGKIRVSQGASPRVSVTYCEYRPSCGPSGRKVYQVDLFHVPG